LAPAEQAPAVRTLLASITGDPVLCIIIAAGLTWAAHSSVAVVLLGVSPASPHFATPKAGLAWVLGPNPGSAINPLLEAGRRDDPASRRLPVGNMINRLVGIVIAIPFLASIAREMTTLQPAAPSVPPYLDEAALETPPLALANAARETLRMGDAIECMLREVMTALMN